MSCAGDITEAILANKAHTSESAQLDCDFACSEVVDLASLYTDTRAMMLLMITAMIKVIRTR